MDAKNWHSLLSNDGLDTLKPALSDELQMSAKTDNERSHTTRELVTEQANNLYCRKATTTVGKPGFIHSYDRIGVLIRQA